MEKLDERERRRLRTLRARAGTNPRAFAYLEGCLLALEGHPREALKLLGEAAHSQNINRSSAVLQMAKVHGALREWAASADCCRQVLEIAPDDSTARFRLARALLGLRQFAPAADEARIALSLRHYFPQAALVAGIALWQAGDTAKAGEFLKRAVAQNPVYPAAQSFMAAYCRQVLHDGAAATQHRRLAREAARRLRSLEAGQRPEGVHRDEFRASFEKAASSPPAAAGSLRAAPLRESIVVVTGLPRSGTSMIMQMLAAGGMTILTDNRREADENNPRGYLEYEKVKSLHRDRSWLDEAMGKAVKVVCPLLRHLPPPKPGRSYRVIVLHRPLEEVAASQRRMLDRLGKEAQRLTEAAMLRIFRQQLFDMLTALNRWKDNGGLDVLDVHYHSALGNPRETANLLAWFLGPEAAFDATAAAAAVAPELHRERKPAT
jgi:tetratricopeptide (TPR) repeat protein